MTGRRGGRGNSLLRMQTLRNQGCPWACSLGPFSLVASSGREREGGRGREREGEGGRERDGEGGREGEGERDRKKMKKSVLKH